MGETRVLAPSRRRQVAVLRLCRPSSRGQLAAFVSHLPWLDFVDLTFGLDDVSVNDVDLSLKF